MIKQIPRWDINKDYCIIKAKILILVPLFLNPIMFTKDFFDRIYMIFCFVVL